jgi:hypothetical protein
VVIIVHWTGHAYTYFEDSFVAIKCSVNCLLLGLLLEFRSIYQDWMSSTPLELDSIFFLPGDHYIFQVHAVATFSLKNGVKQNYDQYMVSHKSNH